jgi:hypothetical protein
MNRDELLAFATWLLKDEIGEGREGEIVDKYLALHRERPMEDIELTDEKCPQCGSDNIETSGIGDDHSLHCTDCDYLT